MGRARSEGQAIDAVCKEIIQRRRNGSHAYSKLLPRVFRLVAAELQRRGWDPIVLLLNHPEEPATREDSAPGGIEGSAPQRRRWLYTPAQEIELLTAEIEARAARGRASPWHRRRRQYLQALLETVSHD